MIDETFDLNDFELQEEIGKGSFGQVRKALNKKNGGYFAAKISIELYQDIPRELYREIKILSQVNHPAVLKFIGFSFTDFSGQQKPIIITELASNGSLQNIIEQEKKSMAKSEWTFTRKLINLYGIANAMKYLHSQKIIHRDLKPANILMDDFLCPKVADFGLSKIIHSNQESYLASKSQSSIKGTPIYIAPEIWNDQEFTQACDVYSYGLIIYEIVTGLDPYPNKPIFAILKDVSNNKRPVIDELVPPAYKNLIEKCWSQNPDDRPTFEQIVDELKTNKEFITDQIDVRDFQDYVDYIEEKQTIDIDKFIKRESQTFKKIKIDESETINFDESKSIICPSDIFMTLSEIVKKMIENATEDPEQQFYVGKFFIEGSHGFPKNTEIGMKYLEQSCNNDYTDAVILYTRQLIEGNGVSQDLEKAKHILKNHLNEDNSIVPLLIGKINVKEGDYKSALNNFMTSAKAGNGEAMYEYGVMLRDGLGCKPDPYQAERCFKSARNNGFGTSNSIIEQINHELAIRNIKDIKNRANAGDKAALYELGMVFYEGKETVIDKTEAAKYFKMSADKGFEDAMYMYAKMLLEGDGIKSNKSEAIVYIKKLVEMENADAMFMYGELLISKEISDIGNKYDGINYIKKAADKGNVEAMYRYAKLLKYGDFDSLDKKECAFYFKMASDMKNYDATYELGMMHYNGDLVPINKKRGIEYISEAAVFGHIEACYKYGKMLIYGTDVPVDKKWGITNLYKAVKANHPEAMHLYGNILSSGDGIKPDKTQGAKYIKMAADLGLPDAMLDYAYKLDTGDGVLTDHKKAAEYLKMAIDKGHARSMFYYSMLLHSGEGIERNESEANRYLQMAVDRNVPEALFQYGGMLFGGEGITPDKPEGLKYIKKAADLGFLDAVMGYASIMNEGDDGIDANKKEAAKYFKLAADEGLPNAAINYASIVFDGGDGVDVNKIEAAKYFKFAADKGYPNAMFKYGVMLEKGDGVDQDKNEAARYIQMAADKGYKDAQNYSSGYLSGYSCQIY